MGKKFTPRQREHLYAVYNGKCAICGYPVSFKRCTIDHKRPLCKGGTNDFRNLQITCRSCNQMKHSLSQQEFLKKLLKLTIHNFKNILKTYLKGRCGV